jgi:hypothetical protein
MKTKPSRRITNRQVMAIAELIVDELFTVNYGHSSAETGQRLAIMQGKWPTQERHLGGRNRLSVKELLVRRISELKT